MDCFKNANDKNEIKYAFKKVNNLMSILIACAKSSASEELIQDAYDMRLEIYDLLEKFDSL